MSSHRIDIRNSGLVLLGLLFLAGSIAFADEGMWLYNAFPRDKVQAKYGFGPTQQWLDHVRLSSVRFNNGASGSFVSPNGLTLTNHHVGATCIQQLSTGSKDYMNTGFYARSVTDEAKCPDLELNQLLSIEDVTTQVNAAIKPEMSIAEAGQARRAAMSGIEKTCASSTGLRCDVVTLYAGGVYNLYEYKKYTDVRLVFAPEFDAAFFGGDPDNFNYPRYDLDVAFFRVYENGKPAHLDNYLHWSVGGVKEGDLIFVSGHPGSTDRLKTVSELEFLRDVSYPSLLATFTRRIALLQSFGAISEENARIATEELFGYQNSYKAIEGSEGGLKDDGLMAAKAIDENRLRAAVASSPKLKAEVGDPWSAIAQAMVVLKQIYLPYSYLERSRGFNSELAWIASTLVRVTREKTKPDGQRLREYSDSALPSLEQRLFSTAPIYKSLETATLADSLAEMLQAMGENNPIMQKVLGGKNAAEVAKNLLDGTKLDDVAVRKQLYAGGNSAIEASSDPLIVLLRSIDPDARSVRKRYDDEVEAVERQEGGKIAEARFAEAGFNQPPDATFTLRLSYGVVRGYAESAKQIPYCTTFAGAYQHATEHANEPPYRLPESWITSKSKLNLDTPLNFAATADTIGGNSGSPLVNQMGEIVGVNFDRNMQALSRNFFFEDKVGRNVSVDVRGIQEALRNIYGATVLADELVAGALPKSAAKTAR
jgi:Peptidase S46